MTSVVAYKSARLSPTTSDFHSIREGLTRRAQGFKARLITRITLAKCEHYTHLSCMPSFPWFLRTQPAVESLSPKRFATFLSERKPSIIARYIDEVRAHVPGAKDESRSFIEDHVASIVAEISDYLATRGSEVERKQVAWLSDLHGLQRAQGEAYSVDDLRREFKILKKIILNEVADGAQLSLDASRLFHDIFETALSHSTEKFIRNSVSELLEVTGSRDLAVDEQRWFSVVFDLIPKPLFLFDLETKRTWLTNAAARDMLGLSYENVDPAHPTDQSITIRNLDGRKLDVSEYPSQRTIRGEKISGEEVIVESKRGRFHVEVFSSQIPAMHGRPSSALILLQDISALKETEARLEDILESTNDGVFAVDRNWIITRVNTNHENLTQIKREDQIGKNFLDLFFSNPDFRTSKYWLSYHKAMNERVPVVFEDYYPPLDLWTSVSVYPQPDGGIAAFFRRTNDEKAVQASLVAAKEEAERANELKSAFLANMSHEIRTPLGAMLGFADLLREPGLTANERQSYLDILTRNGESLSVIINDILDLSKVEAGHLNVEYTDTYPDRIGAEVVSLLRVKSKEKDLVLEYVHDDSCPAVITSDPTRVRQILVNLVGNAIKFTPYGSVKLTAFGCATEDGRAAVCFEVKDTGIGIAAAQVNAVFEMFVQADGTMTRRFGGTGLGLALSRKLARALGGDVSVVETREGFGTTFKVMIEDRPDKHDKTAGSTRSSNQSAYEFQEGALTGLKILVVDDAPDNQQLIWRYLTKQGAQVESAENGLIGYRAATDREFDLILMDIQMPVMDGYTATSKLRESGYRKPIIALTAHAMSEVRKKALMVGYTDHLPKPIDPKELISTIIRHTRS